MLKTAFKYFDRLGFAIMSALSLCGLFLIYSASHMLKNNYCLRQGIWLLLSIGVFFLVFTVKPQNIFRYSTHLYLLLVVILASQLLFGHYIAGTRRWFSLGFINFQFSETMKVILPLLLARFLTRFTEINGKAFLQILLILLVPIVLISMQPDLGGGVILLFFLAGIVFLKKVKPVVLIATPLLLLITVSIGWNYVLKPYQKNRLVSFVDPWKYKDTSGYHVIQSRIAIGSGGLFGKGFLKGSQSQYRFLPTRQTDFIISVLGEEFGFMGVSLLLILFFIFFYRHLKWKYTNETELYFAYLFNGLVICQFFVNIAVATGLLPVMGLPLPFVSYGGSSLVTLFAGQAIVFRIKADYFQS